MNPEQLLELNDVELCVQTFGNPTPPDYNDVRHGEALRDAVPGARLLVLPAAGHEVPPPVWDLFVPALLEHTS